MPEQRTAKDREQHLYLLFDDWDSGYSIRKVSLSSGSGKEGDEQSLSSGSGEQGDEQPLSSGSGEQGDEQPLSDGSGEQGAEPLPGVFMHIRAPRGFPDFFTSAFGAKIVAMHPGADDAGIPMFDVQEKTFIFGPQPNYNAVPIYFPIGDNRLFTLDIGTFDCYLWTLENSEEPWGWQGLPYPPFKRADVSSYGVQPDGCILVSINSGVSFIFDAKEYVWKQYRNWALPFTGRGHYDTSLEGFVGLSKDPETLGYLYCSTMASTGPGLDICDPCHLYPEFKRTKEKVYSKNPAERHVSATLVHMRQGKFCLVECVSIDNGRTDQDLSVSWVDEFRVPPGANAWDFVGGGPQCGRFMYRLKTFSLSYDTKGDLKLKNCKVCCYSLPHEARIGSICLDPVAFWL